MLAIVSGVLLVLFFAKLDQLISLKYQRTFEVKLPFLRFFRPCFPSYDFPLICSCCFSLCYFEFFQEDISRGRLTSMAGVIGCNFFRFYHIQNVTYIYGFADLLYSKDYFTVLAIMVNILVIIGGSGGRWRRY